MLLAKFAGASGVSVVDVRSGVGAFTVPSGVAVGDIVRFTGANTAGVADNSAEATVPAIAVVIGKPTSTTATLLYFGEVTGVGVLTPTAIYFLGTAGGLTTVAPSAVGSVIQAVGQAIDASVLLFAPGAVTVL